MSEAISNVIQENIDTKDNIVKAYSAIFEQDATVEIPTKNEGALNDKNLPETIRNIKTFQIKENSELNGNKIFAERGILGENTISNNLNEIKNNNGIYFLKEGISYSNLPISSFESNNIYCLQIIKIKDTEVLQRFFIINDTQTEVYERIYQSSTGWSEWRRNTKENVSNKVNSLNNPSDETYPTTLAVQRALDTKVNNEKGKGLSTKDFTEAYENKLKGIEVGANKTIIDSKLLDTSERPVQNKIIQQALDTKEDNGNRDKYDKDKDYKGISDNDTHYPSSKSVREIIERIDQNIKNIDNKKVNSLNNPSDETYPTTKVVSDALATKADANKTFMLRGPVEDGCDLNDIKTEGHYQLISGRTYAHSPVTAGMLEVYVLSTSTIIQRIQLPSLKTYNRTSSNGSFENIDWNVVTKANQSDVDAVRDAIYRERDNITPLPFATYTPISTPFNPWDMPNNTIYFGTPTNWYRKENIDIPDTELKNGQTYQLIKFRNNLHIINPYSGQYYYGAEYNNTQYWHKILLKENQDEYKEQDDYKGISDDINKYPSSKAVRGALERIDDDIESIDNNKENISNKEVNSLNNSSNETYPTTKVVSDELYHKSNRLNIDTSKIIDTACNLYYTSWSNLLSTSITDIKDMEPNSRVTVQYTDANKKSIDLFLDSFIQKYGSSVLYENQYYIIAKINIWHNANWSLTYDIYIVENLNTARVWQGYKRGNTDADAVVWTNYNFDKTLLRTDQAAEAKAVGDAIYRERDNITPLPFATYTPVSTPFDPWKMPENSIYYGAPTKWFEDSERNPYIVDTNNIVTRDKFEDSNGNLKNITFQIIKYKNQLNLICPYTNQYFFGAKTGEDTQYWSTNSNKTEINNTYENTFNSYTTQYTGNINVSPTITTDTNNFLSSTKDNTDRTAEVLALLKTGYCKLGVGVFYISGLNMPTYSRLEGCGDKTQIIWKETEDTNKNYIVKMGINTSISNLRINFLGLTSGVTTPGEYNPFYESGDSSATDLKPIGEYTCILFSNTSAGNAMNSKISNVTIMNCAGSGIKTINSTESLVNHLHVVNCDIFNCDCGIYNSVESEFHRFTNINIRNCFYGAYITGGNIIYNSFTIGTCHVSMYLAGEYRNNTHGIIANGEIVHCKDIYGNMVTTSTVDNAYALYSNNVTLGEKISSCSFAYGVVKINESVGVKFFATGFGTCNIKIDNSTSVIFDGTSVGDNVPNPAINNSSNVRFVDCFTRTGEKWDPLN